MAISILDLLLDAIRKSDKSVNQMAKESGVSRSTIGDWFKGATSPTVQNAEAVLNTIGYTLTLTETRRRDGGNS